MKPLSLLAALACAALLAACGDDGGGSSGGGSDEQQIRALVERYMDAFVGGDMDEVCDLLTPEAKEELKQAAAILGGKDCPSIMKSAVELIEEKDREQLKDAKIESVKITGDTALVEISGSDDGPTKVVKRDGKWMVEGDETEGTETAEAPTPDAATVEPEPEAEQEATDEEAAPAQEVAIGEPLRQDGYTVTVTGQERASKLPGDEFSDPVPADGRFVILTLRVRNGGKEVATFDTSLVELVDADGTIYSSETGGGEEQIMALPDYLDERAIQPKTSETGKVAFDVPKSADVVKARFAATLDLFSEDFTGAVTLE